MINKLTADEIINLFPSNIIPLVNRTEEGGLLIEYAYKDKWLDFYVNEDDTIDYLYREPNSKWEEGSCNDLPSLIVLKDMLLKS